MMSARSDEQRRESVTALAVAARRDEALIVDRQVLMMRRHTVAEQIRPRNLTRRADPLIQQVSALLRIESARALMRLTRSGDVALRELREVKLKRARRSLHFSQLLKRPLPTHLRRLHDTSQ